MNYDSISYNDEATEVDDDQTEGYIWVLVHTCTTEFNENQFSSHAIENHLQMDRRKESTIVPSEYLMRLSYKNVMNCGMCMVM